MSNKNLQKTYPPHNSSFRNLSANWFAAAVYFGTFLLGSGRLGQYSFYYIAWIIPLFIFFNEKNSGLVRFHAAQATALFFFLGVAYLAADLIGGFGGYVLFFRLPSLKRTLAGLLLRLPALIAIVYGSYLAIRAAMRWSEFHLPLVGSFAAWLNSRR